MPTFEPLDPGFPVARQVDIDAGPIVMINLCTMAPADEDAFLAAWAEDARFMKLQPGLFPRSYTVRSATTRPISTMPSLRAWWHGVMPSTIPNFAKGSRRTHRR